eukprot:scaffold66665_cov33-Prasinocladus_malaysianus.AAC.1
MARGRQVELFVFVHILYPKTSTILKRLTTRNTSPQPLSTQGRTCTCKVEFPPLQILRSRAILFFVFAIVCGNRPAHQAVADRKRRCVAGPRLRHICAIKLPDKAVDINSRSF